MGTSSNKNGVEESMIKLYNMNTEDFMNNIIARGKYIKQVMTKMKYMQ